jgi:hypothetical protein
MAIAANEFDTHNLTIGVEVGNHHLATCRPANFGAAYNPDVSIPNS